MTNSHAQLNSAVISSVVVISSSLLSIIHSEKSIFWPPHRQGYYSNNHPCLSTAFFKLLILLALCPLSLCAIVEPPRDTASLEGSKDVQLNCSVSQGSTIKWEAVFEWKITSHPIYPGVAANQNFTVAQDGSSISINTLSKSLTGIYICSEGAYSAEARVAAMRELGLLILRTGFQWFVLHLYSAMCIEAEALLVNHLCSAPSKGRLRQCRLGFEHDTLRLLSLWS